MSLEEQLATVGLAWKDSLVGFLVLFVECIAEQHTYKTSCKASLVEAQMLMQWQR